MGIPITNSLWIRPNLWLFICLTSVFLVYPYVAQASLGRWFLDVAFSGSIVLAIFAQTNLPFTVRVVYGSVGTLAVLSAICSFGSDVFTFYTQGFYALFFGLSVAVYSRDLFTRNDVDSNTLLGAACAYILLGFFFATIYAVLLQLDPTALLLPDTDTPPIYHMIYFSFVTLTTLGYGDILPMSQAAQMLAVYEALIGQIFVTVLLAVLVGTHVAKKQTPSAEGDTSTTEKSQDN